MGGRRTQFERFDVKYLIQRRRAEQRKGEETRDGGSDDLYS